MKTTKIEWTDKTWNPITGCLKVPAGCIHCYAEVMSHRIQAMGQKKYQNGFDVTLHEDILSEPLLEDLGDLNHEKINWVIVDGESGIYTRPMKWVLSIKGQVEQQGASFFFKQWGIWGSDGVKRNKHVNGKLIRGELHQSMPTY